MELKKLSQILELANKRPMKKMAVAAAADIHVLKALKHAFELKLTEPLLVGDESLIRSLSASIDFDTGPLTIIHEPDPVKACSVAVREIREGHAGILMKGMVATAPLLKATLDKDNGLKKREVLSHFALFETSFYPKLIGVTDAAMNISPELNEKVAIIENAAEVFHSLGVLKPKVAVLGPVEVVNPKITSTSDAALLTQMYRRHQIVSCIIDGPLALDNAVSPEAASQKNIHSEVAGNADILLAPDLNSGNILYKTMIFLSDAKSAAVILGAKVPVVLTSRADSEETKLYSIALASLI
ncbi:MAG: bifunctional enoyl-CoA hydratase/phosphate acetyltransferase [Bacteroidales bacterium]|nr:bifunctional enoyl-CoA hydratase/phosphate acetyltransferase [Bacteroidales bacterium]